jgi:hypothetical protein
MIYEKDKPAIHNTSVQLTFQENACTIYMAKRYE